MVDQELKLSPPGDVNEELCKFLASNSDDYDDYIWALHNGGSFQSKEERLICAADQLLPCTCSSGIFCYFEIQFEHPASVMEAFTELGLDDFAEVMKRALDLLSLGTDASASEIEAASKNRACFERFLNEAEPLEDFIEKNAAVLETAISKYIRENKDKLRRG